MHSSQQRLVVQWSVRVRFSGNLSTNSGYIMPETVSSLLVRLWDQLVCIKNYSFRMNIVTVCWLVVAEFSVPHGVRPGSRPDLGLCSWVHLSDRWSWRHATIWSRSWHLCWSRLPPPFPPALILMLQTTVGGERLLGFLQTPGCMILQPYSLPVSKWSRSGILVIDCDHQDYSTIDPNHDRNRAQP